METILGWQIAVVISIVVARVFSPKYMILTAMGWSVFSLFAIWAGGLLLLQLGTAWGTVWVMSAVFPDRTADQPVTSQTKAKPPQKTPPPEPPAGKAKVSAPPKADTGIIAEFTAHMTAISDAQEANSPLHRELYPLRIWVESMVETGERCRKFEVKKGLGPGFWVRCHGSEQPISLPVLSIAPIARDALPPLAVSKRVRELEEVLKVLTDAEKKVSRDPPLGPIIELSLTHPFLPFIAAQKKLLRDHLNLLAAPKPPAVPKPSFDLSQLDAFLKDLDDTFGTSPQAAPSRVSDDTRATGMFEHLMGCVKHDASDRPAPPHATASAHRPEAIEHRVAPDPPRSVRTRPPPARPVAPVLGSDAADKERIARSLRIPHLVHFTRCENLPGILEHGLMSVQACRQRGLSAVRNDPHRYDGQPDGISLSITFPNYRMFWKYRQITPNADWAVLLIDPSVLWLKDCAFYPHNAADARMIRQPRTAMKSARALSDMFATEDGREPWLRSDPTDPQAEIMVYQTIEPSLIETIAFETSDVRSRYYRHLGEIDSFYAGPGEGLFASRRHTLREQFLQVIIDSLPSKLESLLDWGSSVGTIFVNYHPEEFFGIPHSEPPYDDLLPSETPYDDPPFVVLPSTAVGSLLIISGEGMLHWLHPCLLRIVEDYSQKLPRGVAPEEVEAVMDFTRIEISKMRGRQSASEYVMKEIRCRQDTLTQEAALRLIESFAEEIGCGSIAVWQMASIAVGLYMKPNYSSFSMEEKLTAMVDVLRQFAISDDFPTPSPADVRKARIWVSYYASNFNSFDCDVRIPGIEKHVITLARAEPTAIDLITDRDRLTLSLTHDLDAPIPREEILQKVADCFNRDRDRNLPCNYDWSRHDLIEVIDVVNSYMLRHNISGPSVSILEVEKQLEMENPLLWIP